MSNGKTPSSRKPSEIVIATPEGIVREASKIEAAKHIFLRSKKSLVMPRIVTTPEGLVYAPRRIGKTRIGAVPVGYGIFAKFSVQVIDQKGSEALAKFDAKESQALKECDLKALERRAKIIAVHAIRLRNPLTGKMVKKIERPCHSFTRNFGFFERGFLQNPDATVNLNETLTDDAGASFLCRLKSNAGVAANIAIISGLAKMKFGNSSAALSTTQFNLQGVLLGPSTEATVVVVLIVEDSTNTIFTVTGQVLNGTGGGFTVEEMGLFSELGNTLGVANNTTMMLRDLTGPVAVANGQTIIGQYTFTVAV